MDTLSTLGNQVIRILLQSDSLTFTVLTGLDTADGLHEPALKFCIRVQNLDAVGGTCVIVQIQIENCG